MPLLEEVGEGGADEAAGPDGLKGDLRRRRGKAGAGRGKKKKKKSGVSILGRSLAPGRTGCVR